MTMPAATAESIKTPGTVLTRNLNVTVQVALDCLHQDEFERFKELTAEAVAGAIASVLNETRARHLSTPKFDVELR